MHEVSERIYNLIQSSPQYTNSKLAKFIGVDRSTVSKWFNDSNEPEPDYKNVVKAAEFFDVSVEYLLTGKETGYKNFSDNDGMVDVDAELKNLLNKLTDGRMIYSAGRTMSDVAKKALINSLQKDLELIELMNAKQQ